MSNYKFNAEAVKNACICSIRNWFAENGPDCNAVIGISGGKDSTVAAALLVEALGKDRVIGIMMPNGNQSDLDDAKAVCKHLGILSDVINIQDAYLDVISSLTGSKLVRKVSDQTAINLAPRLRMSYLYAISQSLNGRVINTSNFSEDFVGYATRYGDTAGDFAPLAKLTVEEVKAIGYALHLPAYLIKKAPADGLVGKTDEDNLGFTYQELDDMLRRNIKPAQSKYERIMALHNKNKFKLEPMPCFVPAYDLLYAS